MWAATVRHVGLIDCHHQGWLGATESMQPFREEADDTSTYRNFYMPGISPRKLIRWRDRLSRGEGLGTSTAPAVATGCALQSGMYTNKFCSTFVG